MCLGGIHCHGDIRYEHVTLWNLVTHFLFESHRGPSPRLTVSQEVSTLPPQTSRAGIAQW